MMKISRSSNRNIMKAFRLVFSFVAMLCAQLVIAQNSNVVLTDLKASKIMSPSANELNSIMLEVKISNPLSLKYLLVEIKDVQTFEGDVVQKLYIVIKDEKPFLKVDDYLEPIENGQLQCFVKVRDQITNPYQIIKVSGVDNNGNATNELQFNFPY